MIIQLSILGTLVASEGTAKMNFFVKFLYDVLQGINSVIGNYGWSIVIFTIVIRLALLPLDLKAKASTRMISAIQPELKEINEKYKNDPDKKNKKTMELYKKYNINPFGGCLPMLIQLPIFFALFAALRAISDAQLAKGAVESFLWIKNVWRPDTPMVNWETGKSIAAFSEGMNGLFILPVLAGISSYYYSKLTSASSGNEQMKGFTAVLPIMSVWFTIMYTASFAIYWVTNNLFQIVQQVIYNRVKPDIKEGGNK